MIASLSLSVFHPDLADVGLALIHTWVRVVLQFQGDLASGTPPIFLGVSNVGIVFLTGLTLMLSTLRHRLTRHLIPFLHGLHRSFILAAGPIFEKTLICVTRPHTRVVYTYQPCYLYHCIIYCSFIKAS